MGARIDPFSHGMLLPHRQSHFLSLLQMQGPRGCTYTGCLVGPALKYISNLPQMCENNVQKPSEISLPRAPTTKAKDIKRLWRKEPLKHIPLQH